MARSRNIKPGFFKNELLADMPPETRLLFMGLWCLADREGRFEDRPKKIKMELFPCDSFSIEDSLTLLERGGFLLRYEVGGKRYAQVVNFTKHQMPHHKEVPSEIPAPPGHAQITKHTYDVSKETREAVFARDGDACLKCGTTENLSLDHIVPLASGGDNATSNLQTLCKSCNSSKGNTTKDHRQTNVDATLKQSQNNVIAHCPSDSLIPDSGFSDSLIPESKGETAPRKRAAPFPLPEWINRDHWDAWHSCSKRRNATDKQKQLAVDKLTAWRSEGIDHAAALENAAIGGWQGLFKPDEQKAGGGSTVNKQEALEQRNRGVASSWAAGIGNYV